MRNPLRLAFPALALALFAVAPARAGEHRLGIGYHYFRTVDDVSVPSGVDDSGKALVFSYQYLPGGLIRFEGDLERFSGGFGGSDSTAWAPQAYVLLGRGFYGGVGVGITNSSGLPGGDDWSDPWYAARVGLDLLLLPRIHLDLNANYRANSFTALDQAKSDTVTFGASARFSF